MLKSVRFRPMRKVFLTRVILYCFKFVFWKKRREGFRYCFSTFSITNDNKTISLRTYSRHPSVPATQTYAVFHVRSVSSAKIHIYLKNDDSTGPGHSPSNNRTLRRNNNSNFSRNLRTFLITGNYCRSRGTLGGRVQNSKSSRASFVCELDTFKYTDAS